MLKISVSVTNGLFDQTFLGCTPCLHAVIFCIYCREDRVFPVSYIHHNPLQFLSFKLVGSWEELVPGTSFRLGAISAVNCKKIVYGAFQRHMWPRQKCTQLLTPFSGTVYHVLSHGGIHIVWCASFKKP